MENNRLIKEAIILAGGFGTRLKSMVSDLPKPMAPVNGKPFLEYLLYKLSVCGFEHIVISTGYMHEKIEGYFGDSFKDMRISYSREDSPLGTGGAIKLAFGKIKGNEAIVLNGDTFFDIDFKEFSNFYFNNNINFSIALRKVDDTCRYGAVIVNDKFVITSFVEKGENIGKGFINGGIYAIRKSFIDNINIFDKFSFETEILQKRYKIEKIYAIPFDAYFIDIGVPEDYIRVQNDFINLFRDL